MATGAGSNAASVDDAGGAAGFACCSCCFHFYFDFCWLLLLLLFLTPAGCIEHAAGPATLPARFGYASESHRVRTADGYILSLVHMRARTASHLPVPPVLLWPGMFGSSDVFMILGPKNGAAFLLADAGFDVWIANSRGNIYSRKHMYLPTNSSAFWDFSWHEIGYYDMPAVVDYVLALTGYRQLFLAGHSMGNTAYFVMASARPEYNAKILTAFALAPVVYISAGHEVNVIERIVNMTSRALETANRLNFFEIPGPGFLRRYCSQRIRLCSFIYPIAVGSTYASKEAQALVLEKLPAGGSLRQLQHYIEVWRSNQFRPMKKDDTIPAPYPLHRISAPLYLFRSKNDWSFSSRDMRRLKHSMSFTPREYVVPLDRFQHNDFIFAPQAGQMVYMKMAEIMAAISLGK